ncbi:MAG: twin-arginine translocase TatA/TatE family subunit [Oligoflexia bacterium]|nr:twin-arginine translocase TatA/TatE family subunit [Oligoflexia bacterium]
MGNLGFGELVVIFSIALMVFGAKRIPEIGRAIGKGIGEFKKGLDELKSSDNAKPDDK